MKHSIQQYIDKHQLLTASAPVVVALSGGADSVALLLLLYSLGYRCVAAHCNFHLRADESNRDEQFVVNLCREMAVSLHVEHFDTHAYATQERISIEMAARDLRYAWFEQLRQSVGAQAVATAHHRDDQVETVLLNLTRGTGLRGLCGMHPKNGYIVRPLLQVSRVDIEQYLTLKHQSYVCDSTNAETIYRRNKVRHDLVPMFEALNPSFGANLAEMAHHLAGYCALIDAQVAQAREAMTHTQGSDLHINLTLLHAHPSPETMLYELLAPYGFQSDVIGQIHTATYGISGKTFYAPTHIALKDRQHIIVSPRTQGTEPSFTFERLDRQRVEHEVFPASDAFIALFDADLLPPHLELRPWREGDRFSPIGMNGRMKKVSDFFSDQKFTLHQKQSVRLLADGSTVVWIVGHRIDDRFKITPSTQRVSEISVLTFTS